MKEHTSWLDRLRSRLTGQPASLYANRRLAREDLHALEAQRAQAVRRLTEDIELIDRYVNPLERYMDGDRLLTPLGTILDRRSGKNLPLVWTELDLREFRRWARVICDVNPFAVGFLGLLADFHIRQGFGWQATTHRFIRKIGTSGTDTSHEPSTPHPYVGIAQAVLDEWRDTQQWGLRSREAFRRWRRDGEVFIRFFRGGASTRGLPVIRFVEPEQVGPPSGDDPNEEWSFGIRTDPQDVENVISYFVRDPMGTGSEGIEVPATRILHLRANVDVSIKRGLPDFLPVQDDLERVRRMIRNMGEVAAIQSAIAWVSQYATATPEQVGTLIRAGSDYTRPKIGDPSDKYMDVVNYEPGTVLHMDNNRQFVPGPVATGTPGFIQVEQAILRGCGARWRFPEYFSGDASNNNMASSVVAGSPFVVAVEGNQLEWGVFERAVAKKVLELCAESGRLSEELVAAVDVKVIPPAVALANREEEEKLREMRHKAGVLSVTTWQQQVGLDPKHEAANFEAEAGRKGAEQDVDHASAENPDGDKDPKSEAVETELVWEERYTPSEYLLLDEANRRDLRKKQVTVTRGGETFTTTVYVNPNKKKGVSGRAPKPSGADKSDKYAVSGGKKSSHAAPADPDRVLTPKDLNPPRLRPRKYGPEAGEKPPANWRDHIKAQTGIAAPVDMESPHGHHIKMKQGRGSQVRWVELATNILEFYDIPWFRGTGPEGNLVHAPNVAGQHTTRVAKKLYKELRDVHERNIQIGLTWQKGRQRISRQLQMAGKLMAALEF